MCGPATQLAFTVAMGVMQYQAQQRQANAQAEYQNQLAIARNEQIERNAELANRAFIQQSEQINRRTQQEQVAASEEIQQVQIERLDAQGRAEAAAAAAGVQGLSVQNLLNNFQRQEARYRSAVQQNLAFAQENAEAEKKGLRAQAEGRIASIPAYAPEPVARPSFFGTALGIGGRVLDNYARAGRG